MTTLRKSPPLTPPAAPLVDEQIAELRKDVSAGKRRRIVLLADSAGIPAGKGGEVTRVGEPDVDGSDYIGVRIGGDELFFSPTEIGLGAGRRSSKAGATVAKGAAKSTSTKGTTPKVAFSSANAAKAAMVSGAAKTPRATPAAMAKAAPSTEAPSAESATKTKAKKTTAAASTATASTAKPETSPSAAPTKKPQTARATPAGAKRVTKKGTRSPAVSVTVRSTDTGWTVEAHRGGKVALKATDVRASTVQEIVDALDEDAITGLVREVIDLRRSTAEAEADELRAALARAEAVLAEYNS